MVKYVKHHAIKLFSIWSQVIFTGTGILIDKELTQKSMIILRTVPFEYGAVDWVFGIKFLYETLLQEERLYMYCTCTSSETLDYIKKIFMLFQRTVFNL